MVSLENSDSNQKLEGDDEESLADFNEVLIYLLNMEMGVLYQFYPAKNKLKKLPNLLLKHLSSETFIIDIKSRLYVTGGILADEEKETTAAATAIEVYDETSETWSIFINNINSIRISPTSSIFSIEDSSSDQQHRKPSDINETKRFFKLKMSLV